MPMLLYSRPKIGWADHSGALKLACSEGVDGLVAPELAEALAVRRALALTREKGFRNIILESDCLSLIQKITASEKDRSPVGSVVGDIRSLASEFAICSFKHVGRKLNVAAHTLARCSEPSTCNLSFDVIPDCIREVLCNDVG
jgi:hypothetical protein